MNKREELNILYLPFAIYFSFIIKDYIFYCKLFIAKDFSNNLKKKFVDYDSDFRFQVPFSNIPNPEYSRIDGTTCL